MALTVPLNPALYSLPVYQPGRPIEEVARELNLSPKEIIKLASNENPIGPSPAALAAMQRAAVQMNLYPDGNAFCLKERLAAKLNVSTTNLILGNGSNEIIEFLGHAVLEPGVDVIVSQYCFAIYPIITRLFGGNLITVPAKAYGHDLQAMTNAVTSSTRAVFVANPNNPTGTVASKPEVFRFIQAIPPHVLIVMDEAYIEFLDDPTDLLPLIRESKFPNLILMRTFSKIYGLAGLRLGYGIGHPELVAALEKIRQPFNINAMAQAAALAALDDDEHLRRTSLNNHYGLKFLETGFRQMHLEYVPSSANFVLVKVGDGQKVFLELQKLGVITRPMGGYQLPEWIRVSVGSATENTRCLAALRQVLGLC